MPDVRRLSRGLSHDLLVRLEDLGLTPDLAQQVVEDRTDNRGRAMVAAAKSGTVFVVNPEFTTWKTLQLGIEKPTDPVAELEAQGFKVSDWARQLLAKTIFAVEPTSVDLVKVTVAELGLSDGVTTQDIYDRAMALGLNRLPAEAGYRLRLALTDQPMDEWIRVGMDPIADSDDDLDVFHVDRDDGGQWLDTYYAAPTRQWGAGHVWVFGRSKQ